MKKLLLIDSNAVLYRAFYALPETLTLKDGKPINAIYGFTQMLLGLIELFQPEYVICAFDLPKPTFRDKLYPDYRAQRKPTPDNLITQIKPTKKLLNTFKIPIYEQPGFEADDVIGTLSKLAKKHKLQTIIITGDRDLLQLVNSSTKVYMPVKGLVQGKLYGKAEVWQKYGIHPHQIVDYKALMGDPSDNYKGVKGIGPKSASKLITEFDSLEKMYNQLDKVSDKHKRLLLENKKNALIAKELAQIVTDMKLKLNLKQAKLNRLDTANVKDLFDQLQFRSHWKKVKKLYEDTSIKEVVSVTREDKGEQLEML